LWWAGHGSGPTWYQLVALFRTAAPGPAAAASREKSNSLEGLIRGATFAPPPPAPPPVVSPTDTVKRITLQLQKYFSDQPYHEDANHIPVAVYICFGFVLLWGGSRRVLVGVVLCSASFVAWLCVCVCKSVWFCLCVMSVCVCLCVSVSVCLCLCLSACVSVCLLIRLLIRLSACLGLAEPQRPRGLCFLFWFGFGRPSVSF
jgi:hypothetical protein